MSTAANPRAPGNAPHSDNAPQESTGAVAKDSLAADSIRSGGDFAGGQDTGIMSVEGGKSTLANTDTSGASVLQPASDGSQRDTQNAKGLGSDEKGTTGVKYPGAEGQGEFTGQHNLDGYSGGPSADSGSSRTTREGYNTGADDTTGAFSSSTSGSAGGPDPNISSGQTAADIAASGNEGTTGTSGGDATGNTGSSGSSDGNATGNTSSAADVASSGNTGSSGTTGGDATGAGPTTGSTAGAGASAGIKPYTDSAPTGAAAGQHVPEGTYKPKGANLTEGDIPQTKTFTGNVGGQYDPGRVAEQAFQKNTADTSANAGMPGDKQGDSDNPYDVLQTERA